MNGYETMSESYKILMQRGEIEKEAAEKAIRVYDFLAGCDTDDLCEMIDSSAFKDYLHQYATVIRNTQVKNDPDYLLAFLEDQGNEKKKL